MRIKSATSSCCKKCLEDSLPIEMMERCAREVDSPYDIYERAGIREGIPIPKRQAAHRIVEDMIHDGRFVDFVELLIKVNSEGFMGRLYPMRGLDELIKGVIEEGFSFDKTSGKFLENQRERISPNWGRLQNGDEREMTMLRLDIAGNSQLVKNNPRPKIEKAYSDVRSIMARAVTNRLGRLWSWEGDGALAAFLFGPREKMAIFAGMDILHEVFFYNRVRNPLTSPINLRLGAHLGKVRYSDNELERLKNETVKQVMTYEALAKSNSLCISYNLYITMDQITLKLFGSEKNDKGCKYRLYSMGVEK
jgi:class 3 adenylate cyclase